jgi:uncharacterized protein (DUF433 family)
MIEWRQFFSSDPQVCHGQLCARGTRVFVTNILDSLAEGTSREDILASYPALRPEHIDGWRATWGESARPLLWSHATWLSLHHELEAAGSLVDD